MADADVLVRLQSGGVDTPDPRWAGDLVAYKILPHKGWGRREGLPMYGRLRVTDVDVKACGDRCKRHHAEMEADLKTERFHVRATHWINLNLLAAAQRRELFTTGQLTITAAEFYSRCNNRVAALRTL